MDLLAYIIPCIYFYHMDLYELQTTLLTWADDNANVS